MEKIIEAMEHFGGSFTKALAECYRRADFINARRIEKTFGPEFSEYKELIKNLKNS